MPRVTRIEITGYRSVRGPIAIDLPQGKPLILLGENNTGKSNIARAFELVLGESWPKSHEPEDHEFWDRDPSGRPITIRVWFDNLQHTYRGTPYDVESLVWRYDQAAPSDACTFEYTLSNGTTCWASNATREQLTSITAGPQRQLAHQLSYASKWTLLSKLMRRFHGRLTRDTARVTQLETKFQEIQQIFGGVNEFATFQQELQGIVRTTLGGLPHGLEVDFSAYDPTNFFHSLRVAAKEGTTVRSFDEIGTGEEQLLMIAFARAYARAFFGELVLIIEEPEAHLHPQAQRWLAGQINSGAANWPQLIVTTHSPEFVDLLNLDGLVLVSKARGYTEARQLSTPDLVSFCRNHGVSSPRLDAASILPHYVNASTLEIVSGLFARTVVLVEGQTEHLALPKFAERLGIDLVSKGIQVIPVMGKGNLAKWWRLFNAYGIGAYTIFDNDSSDDADQARRSDLLKSLKIEPDVATSLIASSEWKIEPSFSIFGVDFETTLRGQFPDYAALEAEAQQSIGSSKPLIARYVAANLPRDGSPGWNNLLLLFQNVLSQVACHCPACT